MKLKEIFDQLTYGELSQLAIGGNVQGEINEANYPSVVAHIRLALTALYKRFPLKENRLVLQLLPGVLQYEINSKYAVGNPKSLIPVKYILDSVLPFKDDILKIERVYTDKGHELSLNDGADPFSLTTPSAFALRVPTTIVHKLPDTSEYLLTDTLELVYRANHPLVEVGLGYFAPERIEIELPYSYLEPLLLFVASRMNNPSGMTNEFHAGNSYYAKYEAACQQLEQVNLRVDQGAQNTGIQRGGWV